MNRRRLALIIATVLSVSAARGDDQHDFNETYEKGNALHTAIEKGDVKKVKMLLTQMSANSKHLFTEDSALKCAINQPEIVRILIKAGADPNTVELIRGGNAEWFGATTLHHAASSGPVETARILLDAGADVNARNDLGETPLVLSARYGQAEMVKLLISRKANLRYADGRMAMSAATDRITHLRHRWDFREECQAIVSALNEAGIPTDITTEVALGNVDRVHKLLKERPARASYYDVNGAPVLTRAAGLGDNKLVALLLDAGAHPDSGDDEWFTALHHAVSSQHPETVKLLLTRRANVNARTKDGITPLHLALQDRKRVIAPLLLKAGAEVNAPDNYGNTPYSGIVRE